MPWNLLTTLLLTPRTGPLVVSMTRVRESAIASVTVTPRTTRIDAERPMPAHRSRQRTLLSRPSETSAICRTPIVSSPCLSLDWDPKRDVVPTFVGACGVAADKLHRHISALSTNTPDRNAAARRSFRSRGLD